MQVPNPTENTQMTPIRPPTLNWEQSSTSQFPTTTFSNVATPVASGSVGPERRKEKKRPRDKEKDKSRSRHHNSSADKGKSRAEPSPQVVYDAPTPASGTSKITRTPSFRVNDYVHDPSPPGSEVVVVQDNRPKKTKTTQPKRQSQPCPDMQQYDDGQSQYVRRPTHQRLSHAQRQDDGGGYPEESAESPGPSVSEVMAMQARTERRPRKSHRQDSHPPSQQYEGHSRHDSVDHSHASSSRKKQSSRSAAADLRCLTLLIEDKRFHPPENLLTEVHVRLRETADGHWADAKDICDELQFGPSRIDGPAKVYAMRGKYKQYWLRVTAEGGNDCTPVNLKVTPQRTLEVFIEHSPSNTAGIQAAASRARFQMHTPVTETVPSSPSHGIAAPQPVSPFPLEQFHSPHYDYDDPGRPQSAVPRKRRHTVTPPPVAEPVEDPADDLEGGDPVTPSAAQTSPTTEVSATSRVTQSSTSTSTSARSRQTSGSDSQSQASGSSTSHGDEAYSPAAVEHPLPAHDFQDSFHEPLPERESFMPTEHSSTPAVVDEPLQPPSAAPTPSIPPSISASASFGSEQSFESSSFPGSVAQEPSLSLPGPSAAKKPKTSHPQREDSATPVASPSILTPSSGTFGAFGGPSMFASSTSAFGGVGGVSNAGFRAPSAPTGFGQSSFGGPSAFGKTTGFGLNAFQAAANKLGGGSLANISAASPAAASPSPTASTSASSEVDTAVGQHLRSLFSKEEGWADFVASRSRVITIAELIDLQYSYVQSKMDMCVGKKVLPGSLPEAAVGAIVTKAQVLKAFNMNATWGEECSDILYLTELYGPRGERYENPQVVKMMHDPPPVTTGMYAKQYLAMLRDIHARWDSEH